MKLDRSWLAMCVVALSWVMNSTAFGHDLSLIAVAAGLLYPFFHLLIRPIWASAAMSLSYLSVVRNALRLRRVSL